MVQGKQFLLDKSRSAFRSCCKSLMIVSSPFFQDLALAYFSGEKSVNDGMKLYESKKSTAEIGAVSDKDINKPKSSVERWLKSKLGLKGSCTDLVEAHLTEKIQNRSAAEKKFKWDIAMFIIYLLFLILYSISACSTNMRGKLQVRSMLEDEIGFFDDVQEVGRPLLNATYARCRNVMV